MSASNSGPLMKMVPGPIEPSGSGIGYLLIGGMAVAMIALGAYGFTKATGLPPLIGISLAALTCVVRFFMLRRRPSHERLSSSGMERAAVCAPASSLAIALAAFAVYSQAVSTLPPPIRPRLSATQLEAATVAIEDYYRTLRAEVGARNNLNERRLSELNVESPTPDESAELERLKREQQELRPLLRIVVAGVRPANPVPLPASPSSQEDEEPAPMVKIEAFDEEASLRARYEKAARLHAQLPAHLRDVVTLPRFDQPSVEAIRGGVFEQFLRDTLALTSQAIGSWAVPAILELFIVILTLTNRRRD